LTASGELFVTEDLRDLVVDELRKAGLLKEDEEVEIECPDEWRDKWGSAEYPEDGEAKIYKWIENDEEVELGKVEWKTNFYVEDYLGGRYIDAEPVITKLEFKGKVVIEEEPKPDKIFLVAQNIDYLKGKYFVSAVVIAKDKKQAVNRVSDYLSEYGDVIFDEERVKAMEIGSLTSRPNPVGLGVNQSHLGTTELLALEIGEDYNL